MKMFQSGLPSKKQAQESLRRIKAAAAKSESSGDRVSARAQQAMADWVTEKIQRGDYDD